MFFEIILPAFILGCIVVLFGYLCYICYRDYKRRAENEQKAYDNLDNIAQSLIHIGIDIDELVDRCEDFESLNFTDDEDI